MRILIASDDQLMAQRVQTVLARSGAGLPAGHVVPLDSIADRSGLTHPDLIVFVMPDDPRLGLAALRETRNTLPHMHVLATGAGDRPQADLGDAEAGGGRVSGPARTRNRS